MTPYPDPPTTDPPILRCGEREPGHEAPAATVVQYAVPVPLSAAHETRPAYLFACAQPECLDSAVAHAESVSPTPPEVTSLAEVDRGELEALTGLDLSGWTP